MGPKSNKTVVLVKREETQKQTHREGRWPSEDRGRDWSETSTREECQGLPATTASQ